MLAAETVPVTGIEPPSPYFLMYPVHRRESRQYPFTEVTVPPRLTLMTIELS